MDGEGGQLPPGLPCRGSGAGLGKTHEGLDDAVRGIGIPPVHTQTPVTDVHQDPAVLMDRHGRCPREARSDEAAAEHDRVRLAPCGRAHEWAGPRRRANWCRSEWRNTRWVASQRYCST